MLSWGLPLSSAVTRKLSDGSGKMVLIGVEFELHLRTCS